MSESFERAVQTILEERFPDFEITVAGDSNGSMIVTLATPEDSDVPMALGSTYDVDPTEDEIDAALRIGDDLDDKLGEVELMALEIPDVDFDEDEAGGLDFRDFD